MSSQKRVAWPANAGTSVVMNFILNGQSNLPNSNIHFACYFSRNCIRKGLRMWLLRILGQIHRQGPQYLELEYPLGTDINFLRQSGTPWVFAALPLCSNPSPTEFMEDPRMTHHVTQIVTELEKNGGHLMALGTCSLPGLVEWFEVFFYLSPYLLLTDF